ncbi:MAG: LysR family transcriptional regulator [Oscillospiraceae bacterium]|nr:LysR family transcriptional regulator [Oscillospiraceae bacterium]
MLNEAAIRCFLTLARTLSFTETAKVLYMTQQSVSKYIAKLEEDLGFSLFVRTHHYVRMTRAGETFFALFQDFSERFGSAMEETKQYYSQLYHSLHIGYLEWLEISTGISRALKLVKSTNPELRFIGERHPQYELNALFLERKLDLIITYQEFAPRAQGLKKLKVLDTPLVLLVSPDHPKALEGATADDFKTEPFIKAASSRETLSESKSRARRQCRELGFAPSSIIIAPNLESAYMATEFGQGVLVSTMLSRMSLHSELKCYPIGVMEQLLCFWHGDQENPAVEAFASSLEQVHQ